VEFCAGRRWTVFVWVGVVVFSLKFRQPPRLSTLLVRARHRILRES